MDFRRYVWGWETLISRYRVCSELAGSQSERVLTLAAHSVLPRQPLLRSPFRPLCFPPFCPCSLVPPSRATLSLCHLCRRRKLPSPPPLIRFLSIFRFRTLVLSFTTADHIRPWRKLRSFPSAELVSESTFRSFFSFFVFFFGFLRPSPFLEGYATVVAVAGNIGRA